MLDVRGWVGKDAEDGSGQGKSDAHMVEFPLAAVKPRVGHLCFAGLDKCSHIRLH